MKSIQKQNQVIRNLRESWDLLTKKQKEKLVD